jgi:predicted metalloprotease
MKWRRVRNPDVIDRRGARSGGLGLPMGRGGAVGGGLGLVGVLVVVALHVQRQLGTSDEVRGLQRDQSDEANELSVRLELQADCYSGGWANTVYKQGDLEKGDVREATRAAGAVGDDRLQRQATGSIDPDSFTHGTSEQRRTWFENGYESGDPDACDTFSPEDI